MEDIGSFTVTSSHKLSPLSHAWPFLVFLPPLSRVVEEPPTPHESVAMVTEGLQQN